LGEVELVKVIEICFFPREFYTKDDRIITIPPERPELYFGDYTEGRFAWILENPIRYDEPIPAKGALGLWEWRES
jgi:hypothetical protein